MIFLQSFVVLVWIVLERREAAETTLGAIRPTQEPVAIPGDYFKMRTEIPWSIYNAYYGADIDGLAFRLVETVVDFRKDETWPLGFDFVNAYRMRLL